MSREEDRPAFLDREKKSFSELDRMRREGGSHGDGGPRRPADAARARAATQAYLKEIDGLFVEGRGGSEGVRLAAAMRDSHGTPALAGACREYRDTVGFPTDPSLLGLFLDSEDRELILDGIGALRALHDLGDLPGSSGLRSQLRMLAEHSDDDVAETAEEFLAAL